MCLARSRLRLIRLRDGNDDWCLADWSHPARLSAGWSANSRSNVSCSRSRTHALDHEETSAVVIGSPKCCRSDPCSRPVASLTDEGTHRQEALGAIEPRTA